MTIPRSAVVQGLFLRPGTRPWQVPDPLAQSMFRQAGYPLPEPVRSRLEAALGANFADVRVHVGGEAARIQAKAFTVGSSIHFAPGQYAPHTAAGQRTIAHELAHVLQQRAGRVHNPFGSGLAVVHDTALEAEADRLSLRATADPPGRSAVQPPRAVQARLRSGVVQRLVVRVSEGHGQALSMGSAVFQAEVEDAAQYLERQGHGPVVDYYTDAGPYPWARGTAQWKADRSKRNYVVAHGDHGGVGIGVDVFANGLIARGLQSGDRVKFIVCSIAKAPPQKQVSYAQALKAKLKESGVDVEIVAADRYVKYSAPGKMIYSHQDGTYNEERDEKIARLKWDADQEFGLFMLKLIEESFDLRAEVLYNDDSLVAVKEYLKQRGIKAGEFQYDSKTRPVEQANANLLKKLRAMVKDNAGAIHPKLAAFFSAGRGVKLQAPFLKARAALNTKALEIWRTQAEWELHDYKKQTPGIFQVDPNHPRRAPRDDPNFRWSVF